jgi:uncharacterized protein YgiM (DUF1202 family)
MNCICKFTTVLGVFPLLFGTTSLAQTPAKSTPCQIRAYVKDKDPQGLNVRTAPSSASAIIGNLPTNTEVKVFASKGTWMLVSPLAPNLHGIKFQGRGWVYTPLLGISTRGYDRNNVSVFARASYQSAVVGQIPSSKPVNLLSCQGQWALVEKQRISGWLPPQEQCSAALTTCP